MSSEANEVMKRMIQKLINEIIKANEFIDLKKVTVFFAFGSKHKTAMCDWVYGLRVVTDAKAPLRNELVRSLQSKIKSRVDRTFQTSVCCTDVIFNNSNEL